jgi:hypothetical protein
MSRTAPSRCSTCGVLLVGGVRIADGIDAGPWLAIFTELRAAVQARDWDRAERVFADGLQQTSHERGLRLEARSAAEYARSLASVYNRDGDGRFELIAARGGTSLMHFHAFGPGDDEIGPWDVARVIVSQLDEDRKVNRAEFFDETDIERARARFEEIAGA